MTADNVVQILGQPLRVDRKTNASGRTEVAVYTGGQLKQRYDGALSAFGAGFKSQMAARNGQPSMNLGEMRITFVNGNVAETQGFVHGPDRFPTPGMSPDKILIVNVARLYDESARTKSFNKGINDRDTAAQAEVDKKNAAGNALVAEYQAVQDRLKGLAGKEKREAEKVSSEMLKKIKELQAEIGKFIMDTRNELQRQLAEYRAQHLVDLKATVERFRSENGYEFVFDSNGTAYFMFDLLPPGTAGKDQTDALVKLVDEKFK